MILEATALSGCFIAVYYDRGSNPHIPDLIPLTMALVGVVEGQWHYYGVAWGILMLALLWLWNRRVLHEGKHHRVLEGGDVKLLMGLGFLLPFHFPMVVLRFVGFAFLYSLWANQVKDRSKRPFAWMITLSLIVALVA